MQQLRITSGPYQFQHSNAKILFYFLKCNFLGKILLCQDKEIFDNDD